MRKQLTFLLLIFLMLYIGYKIFVFKYNEYKINSNIEFMENLTKDIESKIDNARKLISYKTSKPYKNKVLKAQQGYKNIGEMVVYLVSEERYNKFTKEENVLRQEINTALENENNVLINEMGNFEKWIYFLFKKEM